MVANILLFNPKGMAAKGAGATAERSDRVHHFHHREEVVATTISRRVNHYRFALRTSSDMPPSASPHSRAPLRPAVLPAQRANLTAKKSRL